MDLNGDGNKDILSGSYSRMQQPMAGLFQVLWGKSDGSFAPAEVLNGSDGEPLIIPPGELDAESQGVSLENICTRPTAVDWDSDGDLDLIVGNFGGSFYIFLGEGDGNFQAIAQPLMVGDSLLRITGHHSDPFVVDWDHDGDLDLLSGSSQGGVQWAENQAGHGKQPEFKQFVSLVAPETQNGYDELLSEADLAGPTSSTRVWVDDVNGDGKLDLLVGDSTRLASPAAGLSKEQYEEKRDAWQKAMEEASAEYTAAVQQDGDNEDSDPSAAGSWLSKVFGWFQQPSSREQAQQKMNELYRQRSEFIDEESTGFVWLYLQK